MTLDDREMYRFPLPSPVMQQFTSAGPDIWLGASVANLQGYSIHKGPQLVAVEAAPGIPSLLICVS